MRNKHEKITLLSSRFCRASFPVLSLISTFLGWEMSVCRSMTRPSLLPLHPERAPKSSVLLSEEPSTGQNTPQNFCLGLDGLSEPMLLKKSGTSPAVDMPCRWGVWGCVGFWGGSIAAQTLRVSQLLLFLFLFCFFFFFSAPRTWTATAFLPVFTRRWSHCDKRSVQLYCCVKTLPLWREICTAIYS